MFRLARICTILAIALLLVAAPAAAQPGQPTGAVHQSALISDIEINQGLGKQLFGAQNYVAGKDTAIIAYLSEAVSVDPAQTMAGIMRNGTVIAQLQAKSYSAPTNKVEFVCPSREQCGGWAAGVYLFGVRVNGVDKTTEGSPVTFSERAAVRVMALPVKANYNGQIVSVQGEKWKQDIEFTKQVYPLAPDKVIWDIRGEFDASDAKFNLETDNGRAELWQALTNLMPQECAANPKGAGCYDLIVGFIEGRPKTYPNGTLQGYTYGKPTNIVVSSDQDAAATVAHEIAHVYGVGDTYNGGTLNCAVNPAPNGFRGADWNTRQQTECTAGREAYSDSMSATKIYAVSHPYDISGRGLLGDMACYMGSANFSDPAMMKLFWTTPEAYDHLFKQLAPAALAVAQSAPTRLVAVAGMAYLSNTVAIEPWYSFTATAPAAVTGTHAIEALDAEGHVLARQGFTPSFYVNATPPTTINPAPFGLAVSFPVGTAAFRILSDTVPCQIAATGLYTVPVSASEPTLAITAPATPGATISSVYTITWSAEDADGDTLIYTVEYSRDGVAWEVLISDLTAATWTEDFSDLGGSTAAQIRVIATDGVNAARATSVSFVVPFKAPEVYIDGIANGDRYDYGEEVAMEGAAYDLQDEAFPDASLVWRSDRQGQLGRGSLIFADNLLPGPHVITLRATNSMSLTTVATATITIGHPLTPETSRQSGRAGAMLSYTLRLTNTAAVADTFALSAVGQSWSTHIATSSPVALAAGAATDIAVHVTIPVTATVSASDEVFILAASETFTNTLSSEPLTAASLLISSVQGSSYQLFLPLVRKG
jgi:hypothetical protein